MKLIKKKKGSAMIESIFEMAIIFTLIAGFIVLFPPFITNFKLTFCTKEIVRAIEVSGSVKDNDVRDTVNKLIEKNGLDKNNVQNLKIEYPANAIHTCGNHRSSDKKLKMRSSFTISFDYPVEVPVYLPTLSKDHTNTIDIKKSLTGISQVYWK